MISRSILAREYGMEVHPGYHTFFRAGLNSVEDKAFTGGLGIRVPYVQFDYTYMTEKDEERARQQPQDLGNREDSRLGRGQGLPGSPACSGV